MRILLVEDEEVTAAALRGIVASLGHQVTVAADGTSAWRLLQEGHIPVVLSDWMMPGLDGLSLCRHIRGLGDSPYTYIILLSVRDRRADRMEGLRAGADDFLVKPVEAEELAVRLEIARRILSVQERLERQNASLTELATTDDLTGLVNRREFRRALVLNFALAERQGLPLSLILFDIDHFKDFNDTFGHPAGDEALPRSPRSCARRAANTSRSPDSGARSSRSCSSVPPVRRHGRRRADPRGAGPVPVDASAAHGELRHRDERTGGRNRRGPGGTGGCRPLPLQATRPRSGHARRRPATRRLLVSSRQQRVYRVRSSARRSFLARASGTSNSSARMRSRSRSIGSGVAPRRSSSDSVIDSATSPSPAKTRSAPACRSAGSSARSLTPAAISPRGLSSRAGSRVEQHPDRDEVSIRGEACPFSILCPVVFAETSQQLLRHPLDNHRQAVFNS